MYKSRFLTVVAIVSGSLMLIGIAYGSYQSVRITRYQQITGRVVAQAISQPRKQALYLEIPQIESVSAEYRVDGILYKAQSQYIFSDLKSYKSGDAVAVHYNPADPQIALIGEWFSFFGGALIFLLATAFITPFIGLIIWLAHRDSTKTKARP